jgi:glycosyltransferase involved in cell wall biosynthesis
MVFKMNVLHVVPSFYPCLSSGGVVNASYQLAKQQVAQGKNVSVLTTDSCTKRLKFENRYGVDVDGVNTYYFKNLSNKVKTSFLIDTPVIAPFKIKNIIKNFDVLHIHEHRHSLAILSYYFANKHNIPYVVQAHGSVLPFFQKQRMKKVFDKLWGFNILKNASKVLALTEVEKNQYLNMGVCEGKIEIVPLGISLEEYSKLPSKGKFRHKYNIAEDENLLLFIGRIHKIKGLDLLLHSFKTLIDSLHVNSDTENSYSGNSSCRNNNSDYISNNSTCSNNNYSNTNTNIVNIKNSDSINSNNSKEISVKLAIVGPDDGFLSTLKKLVDDLNLEDKVIITGSLFNEDKREALVDCDIFLMPSKYESFTTSGLEAMASGKPLVITKNNHIHKWVNNNVGFSVNYDKKQFAETVKNLLTNDNLRKTFGKEGKRLVNEKYNWTSIERQINDIYTSIIS